MYSCTYTHTHTCTRIPSTRFGTYLFQVGLLGILAKEFRAALWVLPAYFVVFAIHAVHKIVSLAVASALPLQKRLLLIGCPLTINTRSSMHQVLMSKGIVGVDLWQNGLFTALSMLSKLGECLCSC